MTSELPTPENKRQQPDKNELDSGTRQPVVLGEAAVLLGQISRNPEHQMRKERTIEDSAADLDERTKLGSRLIEREGLVRIPGPKGEIDINPLEETPAPAPNGGRTSFDWTISEHPSALFAVEKTDLGAIGYRGYIDPSGPDYRKS